MPSVFYFTDTSGFGGAEQALLTLMAGLDRRQWQPVLIYHPAPALEPLLAGAQRLEVALWPVPRMPDGWEGARRVGEFAKELRAKRPMIFHAHLTWPLACKFGLVGALLAQAPVVIATEHLFVEFRLDISIYLQQRFLGMSAGRYLAVSHDLARRLRQTFHWPAHKVQVIHNGIALEPFDCPTDTVLRNTLSRGSRRPIVLTLARLAGHKGHRYLFEAAALVPEAQFVLAGDGPERPSLMAQVQALGLEDRVTFLGYRSDIPELLACCDMLVLPSLYEGLPLSVLEAMAAGKPVIASAIGGTNEAVTSGETGLLVPPADPVALARAIQSLLNEPSLARRLALAGRARVREEFSAETMVQRVTQVYTELLARHKSSHDRR